MQKLFQSAFQTIDESKAIKSVFNKVGIDIAPQKPVAIDDTTCILHHQKKMFFCEDCIQELCMTCKEKHEQSHAVKLYDEACQFVIDQFKNSIEDIDALRDKVHKAVDLDPYNTPLSPGQHDVVKQGEQDIDQMFVQLQQHLDQVKQDMKNRLREAYKAYYRATIDQKSQKFFQQLQKLEGYVHGCITDFERKKSKGKYLVVCSQKPKLNDLQTKLGMFDKAFLGMCEASKEYQGDFHLQFKHQDIKTNLKSVFNQHIQVQFPGLENGFFPELKKFKSYSEDKPIIKLESSLEKPQEKLRIPIEVQSQALFDPIKSLEKEEFDIRNAKQNAMIKPIKKTKILQLDLKYELKSLKFRQDRFFLKIYDAQNMSSNIVEVNVPEEFKRIATKNFGYLNCGKQVLMTGGQFSDNKQCSSDSYFINVDSGEMTQMLTSLTVARMNHSMVLIQEKDMALVVGGEDEQGNLLDSCESFSFQQNQWKQLNRLNNKGKNLSLCKFAKDSKISEDKLCLVYAFGRNFIERINLNKEIISPLWEEIQIKKMIPLNLQALSFQFDDNLIIICGGSDEKNYPTQDVVFFNPTFQKIEKSQSTLLNATDKFIGGTMAQFVINRIDNKISFISDAFVHEIEYQPKGGQMVFTPSVRMY